MAFSLEILRAWTNGSVLAGAEDMIPPQALRVARNCRLDRTRGLPVSRPGMTQLTSAPIDGARPHVLMHTKLYGESSDWGYAQVAGSDSALYRTSTTWQTPVGLHAGLPYNQILSETNWVDGYTHPWKYFIGGGIARKDNGTMFIPWGMTGPSEAPSAASVAGSTITGGGNVSLGSRDSVTSNAKPPSPLHVPANGAGYFQVYHGQALTGTHTGPADSPTLIDSGRNFLDLGCCPGWFVQGWHGGSPTGAHFAGRISGAAEHELESLSGWGGHLWQPGDLYQVLINMALGSVQWDVHGATGGTDNTLNDSSVDFQAVGVQVGMYLYNLSTGGGGRITELRQTTFPNDTLVLSNGFRAEPGFVEPTRPNADNGDLYMVYNTLSSQSDVISMELYAAPGARLVRGAVFLGVSPQLGDDDPPAGAPAVSARAQKNFVAAQLAGTPPWYRFDLAKGEFDIPTSSPEPFQMIASYIVAVEVSSEPGGIDLQLGTVSMQRGAGPPTDVAVRYTVTYLASSTGEETSPPKNAEQVVLYSNTLTLERQLVRLDLSRIARAPVTGGIDQMAIYRQKEGDALAYLVTTVPSDQAEYLDTVADQDLNIAHVLETDNDPPPPDGVVLFGPGAQQRLFMIRDRNKLRFSKHWEYHKDRASNWPFQFELQIGDGSQEALNGLMTDQSIFVWSEDQTWQIIGQGENAYVPLPVPLSHGLMGRWCLCSGDGRIFFLSKDGIYQQQGLTQQKISGDLDPFFNEETVHGVLPLSRDPGLMARCQMAWYPHPTEPELVLTYGVAGDVVPSRRLVLKKNQQTQQYTDAFFDDCTAQTMQSVYADPQALTLTFGTNHSHIWQGEVPTETTDVGQAIAGRVRLPARDQQAPRVVKTYSDILVEANTLGTVLTVQAAFNRSTEVITAGTVTTGADNVMVELPLAQTSAPAVLRRHHLALDLSWSGTTRMTITQLGWHAQLEAEDLTYVDTGPLVFDSRATLRRVHFTYDCPATVTCQLTVDGAAQPAFILAATTGRTRYDQLISVPPALVRGKIFRLTATSAAPALLYGAVGEFEPEPLPITAWDSRDVPFDTPQILRQLLFDIEAPDALVSATLSLDGAVAETWNVGPTVGRQRINRVTTTGAQALRGTVFRLTLTSPQPFQLWGLEGVVEAQPLPTTFWDSREVTYPTPQILRQVLLDIETPSAATATLYIDGTVRETWTVGPTAGRQRLNRVTTTGTELVRGTVYRLTIAAPQPFTVWGVEAVTENQPLQTNFWDSREVTYDTPQILRQLFIDIDAPAVTTCKIYVDGVLRETFTLGPTNGRERIDHLCSTNPLLRGRVFRITLESAQPFTLWGLTGQEENEPLATTHWDTRTIPFILVHSVKWLALDMDAPGVVTVTTEINGTVRDTRTVPATTGRQRVNVWLPAGIKGRSLRVQLDGGSALQLWGLVALVKELGSSQGYTPKGCLEAIQALQDKSFLANEQRTQNTSLLANEQRVSTKPLVTIDQQRLERPFLQVGGGQ